jgi:acid phosphatase type 7
MSFYLKALAVLAVTAGAVPAGDNHEYDFNACRGAKTAPEQIHLAYASDKGMTVSWNTPAHLSRPTVRFGSSKYNLNHFAWSDVSVTYPTSTTYSNHVTLTGLKPDTVYYYVPQCGDVRHPYSFKTSRPAGNGKPFVFAYVADLGTMGPDGLTDHVGTGAANPLKPGEINTIQSLTQYKSTYDFLWHCMFLSAIAVASMHRSRFYWYNAAGDIAYADYWLKEEIQGFLPNTTIADGAKVYERILNDFYNEMTGISIDRPYMVGPG